MDEAQREIERSAVQRDDEDDDDEEDEDGDPNRADVDAVTSPAMVGGISSWGAGAYGADPERRSVRETDRDLLEEAEVVDVRGRDEAAALLDDDVKDQHAAASVTGQGVQAQAQTQASSNTNNHQTQQDGHVAGPSPGPGPGPGAEDENDHSVVSKVVEFDS